ncbi:MAG TPA: c-type cytochrome [Rhizomicrobium sp.]|nr:c-type cytochrome [Rhizomicrobium sp.]
MAASLLWAALLAMPWPASAAATDQIALGRDRAIESCSACHQVTGAQKPPEPVSDPDRMESVAAPSFAAIAAKYKDRDAELRAFIKAPEHPMKEQQFLESDLGAIAAYIHSLQDSKASW